MEHIVEAIPREKEGRGISRALRRSGSVPGVIYGGDKVILFSCNERKLKVCLQDEAFHSSIVMVSMESKKYRAVLREVQRHPVRRDILHVDFQAVREDREISAHVPLHYINADISPGVKLQHGIFTTIENQISVHCLPQDLPEYIEVDVQVLEIGKSIHLSEIVAPEGVRFDEIVRGNDPVLAAVVGAAAEEVEPVVATEVPVSGETESA